MPGHVDKHSNYHGNSLVHGNSYTDDHANMAHENVAHVDSPVHSNYHGNWHEDHNDTIEE